MKKKKPNRKTHTNAGFQKESRQQILILYSAWYVYILVFLLTSQLPSNITRMVKYSIDCLLIELPSEENELCGAAIWQNAPSDQR